MTHIKSICVYCASSNNMNEKYKASARRFGNILAENNIRLVFGGGRVGLMGILAESVMTAGGQVIGYIPEHLHDIEVGYKNITELHIVDNMHTRKRLMFEQSDAFVTFPGGLGTLDETFEILTWRQIGLHDKSIIIFNEYRFWNPLLSMIDHTVVQKAANPSINNLYTVVEDVTQIVPQLLKAPLPRIENRSELI